MNIRGNIIELKSNGDGTITLTLDVSAKTERTLSKPNPPKSNTVEIDRRLLRDAHDALYEIPCEKDYVSKVRIALSYVLNAGSSSTHRE